MAITKLSNIDNQWFAGGAHVTDTISDSDLAEILNAVIDKTDEIIDKLNVTPDATQRGSAVFAAVDTVAVTFATAFASTPKIVVTPNGNVNTYVSAKSTAGFTVKTSVAFTGVVDWIATL